MNHRPNRLASILVVQLYAALHHVYPKCAFAGDSYSPGVGLVDRAIWIRRAVARHLPLTTSAGQEAQNWLKPSSLDNKHCTTYRRTASSLGVPMSQCRLHGALSAPSVPKNRLDGSIFPFCFYARGQQRESGRTHDPASPLPTTDVSISLATWIPQSGSGWTVVQLHPLRTTGVCYCFEHGVSASSA